MMSPLEQKLRYIDGGPWGRYRDLLGTYRIGEFSLTIDKIPADPNSGPAWVRISVDRRTLKIPKELGDDEDSVLALEDLVARDASERLEEWGLPPETRNEQPPVRLQALSASVLRRSACRLTQEALELRLLVDLPAANRKILAREAFELLTRKLARLAQQTLLLSSSRLERIEQATRLLRDHRVMQEQLSERGLVAFLAEGSLLPRANAHSVAPRNDGLQCALEVPDDLAVTLDDSTGGSVRGLGIPAGVTVIVGGAFHGKSTLLDSIVEGVYPKRNGDGRERVVARTDAVAVRAEEGRSIRSTDLSGFLGEPPSGIDPHKFRTEEASGSTSQAASVVEALELGSRLLLMDEDRAATNFMIRDGRMQRLVPRPQESLIPFVDRVAELYREHGVSTVLVTGGSGDYLQVADTVIQMDRFQPRRRTEDARRIVRETISTRLKESLQPLPLPRPRMARLLRVVSKSGLRCTTRGDHALGIGKETVDLGGLAALVEPGQRALLAVLMRRFSSMESEPRNLGEWVDRLYELSAGSNLDRVGSGSVEFELSEVRRWEIGAVLVRWSGVGLESSDS